MKHLDENYAEHLRTGYLNSQLEIFKVLIKDIVFRYFENVKEHSYSRETGLVTLWFVSCCRLILQLTATVERSFSMARTVKDMVASKHELTTVQPCGNRYCTPVRQEPITFDLPMCWMSFKVAQRNETEPRGHLWYIYFYCVLRFLVVQFVFNNLFKDQDNASHILMHFRLFWVHSIQTFSGVNFSPPPPPFPRKQEPSALKDKILKQIQLISLTPKRSFF